MIPERLMPNSGKVDIFAVHTRLNPPEHARVLHNDTLWITIVREPSALFESLFNFFRLDTGYGFDLSEFSTRPLSVSQKIKPSRLPLFPSHNIYIHTVIHFLGQDICCWRKCFVIFQDYDTIVKMVVSWGVIDITVGSLLYPRQGCQGRGEALKTSPWLFDLDKSNYYHHPSQTIASHKQRMKLWDFTTVGKNK